VKFKPEYGSSDFLSGFFVRKKMGSTGREVYAERLEGVEVSPGGTEAV